MREAENGQERVSGLLKRRDFLKAMSATPLLALSTVDSQDGALVNDVHAGWNPTRVDRVEQPKSSADVQALIKATRKRGQKISVSGSRHATGGQQFAEHAVLVDMRAMNRILDFDANSGVLSIEGGIAWPELIQGYLHAQGTAPPHHGESAKSKAAEIG